MLCGVDLSEKRWIRSPREKWGKLSRCVKCFEQGQKAYDELAGFLISDHVTQVLKADEQRRKETIRKYVK